MDRDRLRKRVGANPIVHFGFKAMLVARTRGAMRKRPRESLRYLFRGREVSNYTYELANTDEMVAMLAGALEADPERLSAHLRELHTDDELRSDLAAGLRTNPRRENQPRYGKRAMDYCIVRERWPAVVFELGTHDGLGAAVILRALERNAAEGGEGRLLSFDASGEAGWLVPQRLRERLTPVVGDVRETLEPALREHAVEYLNSDIAPYYPDKEWALDTTCAQARSELVIRDEVNEGKALPEVAAKHGARYFSFREHPEGHFAPGHLIGIAVLLKRG